jgi:cytochrome c oxidase subunit IV
VRQPGQQDRRAAELERAAVADEFDWEGLAMSRAILLDALFAIAFSVVTVTIAHFLFDLL